MYLFCLMSTHFHLVVETPRGNLGRFMQGVLTGYGVYYNRRHRSHGHVTQGRYGARLVEGDAYLLKLSRYVHLNPVKIARVRSKPMPERLQMLREYGGLTQRAAASILGVQTGVAVNCQLRKLTHLLKSDAALCRTIEKIEKMLDGKQRQ